MFYTNKKLSGDAGFTLVELMITVAIMGVTLSIAIPGYLSWKSGYEIRGAVSQVRSDLNRVKMRAVETRRQCRIVLTSNGYQLEDGNRIMNSSDWGNIDRDGNHTKDVPYIVRDLGSFSQVTITDNGAAITVGTEPTISFSPRGTATLNSFRMEHPDSAGTDIAVNITGRVNIQWR